MQQLGNPIDERFNTYPKTAKALAFRMKEILYEVAKDEKIDLIEESLKWGEPCFKAPDGSPIRMDWKEKTPDNFYIFFICSTTLIETFRELYRNTLEFEGNRAIILKISEEHPVNELKHCLSLALKYHKIKKLPLLGA